MAGHTIRIKKNGRVYGELGPYARRADALADAAALRRPGITVSVRSAATKPVLSAAYRANNPAVAALLEQAALQFVQDSAKSKLREYSNADAKGKVALLRKTFKYTAIGFALRSDRVANLAMRLIDSAIASGALNSVIPTKKNSRRGAK